LAFPKWCPLGVRQEGSYQGGPAVVCPRFGRPKGYPDAGPQKRITQVGPQSGAHNGDPKGSLRGSPKIVSQGGGPVRP
jgi:hypothetical protein